MRFVKGLDLFRRDLIPKGEVEQLGANYLSALQMYSCGEFTYRWTEQFVRDLIG